MITRKWRKLLRWLRKNFPTNIPVKVIRRQMNICGNATSESIRKYYQINVFIGTCSCNQTHILQRDTLLHEWAHLKVFDSGDYISNHNRTWAYWYGKIYTAWEETTDD